MLLSTDDVIVKDLFEAVRAWDKLCKEARVNDDVHVISARDAARKRAVNILNEIDFLINAVPVASDGAGREAHDGK